MSFCTYFFNVKIENGGLKKCKIQLISIIMSVIQNVKNWKFSLGMIIISNSLNNSKLTLLLFSYEDKPPNLKKVKYFIQDHILSEWWNLVHWDNKYLVPYTIHTTFMMLKVIIFLFKCSKELEYVYCKMVWRYSLKKSLQLCQELEQRDKKKTGWVSERFRG